MKPSGWNVGKQYVHLFPSLETRSLIGSKRKNKSRDCQNRSLQIHTEDSGDIIYFFWIVSLYILKENLVIFFLHYHFCLINLFTLIFQKRFLNEE